MNINKIIALKICETQIASDAGKYKWIINLSKHKSSQRGCKHMKYTVKPLLCKELIEIIQHNKTKFNYYVEFAPDQNGYDSILVYIDFKIDETRYQISFHNPYDKAGCLIKYIGTGRKTRWNKKIGGSYNACNALIKYYDL